MDEPRLNGVYSRNNLPARIKKGAYVINLDEYEDTGTHSIALFVKINGVSKANKMSEVIYFDSFGIEHIPSEINKFIHSKNLSHAVENIKSNIFRVQAYDSIMCGYYCI